MDRRETLVCACVPACLHSVTPELPRSQSRMKGDYLFYEEKVETTQEEKEAKAARRFV